MRYFRTDDATYEHARSSLDNAWGLPNYLGTTTCIKPALIAPRDISGSVLLAVPDAFCAFTAAAEMLPQLLSSGAVEEITEEAYRSALQDHSPTL